MRFWGFPKTHKDKFRINNTRNMEDDNLDKEKLLGDEFRIEPELPT
jgi:hypothetical protein